MIRDETAQSSCFLRLTPPLARTLRFRRANGSSQNIWMITSRPPSSLWDAVVFCFTLGFAFSALAAYFYFGSRHFVDHALPAEGVVVALRKPYYSQSETWPVVAFATRSGARIVFQSNVSSRVSPRFSIGQRVDILYDERNPSNARIHSIVDLWGLPLGLGVIGAAFLALGSVVLFRVRAR